MVTIYPAANSSSNEQNDLFHNISNKPQNKSSQSAATLSKEPSLESTKLDCDIYMSRLVTFKSIFGITYLGKHFHSFPNAKYRPFLVISLILYDLLCMAALLYLEICTFNGYFYTRLFRHSSNKLTMNIVFRSSGYCILIEYMAIKLLTLTRGTPLMKTISELGKGVRLNASSLSRYYLVYVVITALAVIHSCGFVFMFKSAIQDSAPLTRWLFNAFYAIEGVIYGANKSCICSLHMYASILICQRISENKANLSACPNFGIMLEDMLQLKQQLGSLNQILSLTLLVKCCLNAILLVTSVCAIDDKLHDEVIEWESLVALGLLFVSQLLDLVISCLSSQSIVNGMGDLVEAIQELTAQQCSQFLNGVLRQSSSSASLSEDNELSQCRVVEDVEYRCLQHVLNMKDSFGYSVMSLFDLRSVLIVAILANVLNYSVLLIQTTDIE